MENNPENLEHHQNGRLFKIITIILISLLIISTGISVYVKFFALPHKTKNLQNNLADNLNTDNIFNPKIPNIEDKITTDLNFEKIKNMNFIINDENIIFSNGQFVNSEKSFKVEDVNFGYNQDKSLMGLIVSVNNGGSGVWKTLVLVSIKDGKYEQIANYDFEEDRLVVESIKIKDKFMTLNILSHTPDDASCCPSLKKIMKLELTADNKIVEVK